MGVSGAAGAVSILLAWGLRQLGCEVPEDVAQALSILCISLANLALHRPLPLP